MKKAVLKTTAKAVTERMAGLGPGPVRAAVVAVAAGTATAALTYRALRSGGETE